MMAKVVGISDPPRPRRRPHPLRGSIVVLAMVGTLGTTGVAFAGGLPDAAQRVVSTWFQTIGVTIPRPDDASRDAQPSGTSIADARSVGWSATGSANAGSDSSADAALTTRGGASPDPDTP